jgi:hypothetical protein
MADGSWGIRVESALEVLFDAIVGQQVEVVRRDGKRSVETVTAVLKVMKPRPRRQVGRMVYEGVGKFTAYCTIAPKEKEPRQRKPRAGRGPVHNRRNGDDSTRAFFSSHYTRQAPAAACRSCVPYSAVAIMAELDAIDAEERAPRTQDEHLEETATELELERQLSLAEQIASEKGAWRAIGLS